MAYANTAAVLRADVQTLVQEAAQADEMFIGEKVFPVFESPTKTGQFPKFKLGTGELLTADVTTRGVDGSYGEIKRAYETDTFTCTDRGLIELVDDAYARDIERFFDAEVLAAKQVYRNVRLGHEGRVATALIDAGVFTATAASVAYTEANLATIAFHLDMLNANDRLNAKGVTPNSIVMSMPVFNRVRRSGLAQNFMRGSGFSTDSSFVITTGDLARSLVDIGINQILVGRINKNNAKKGQAYSATPVWPNTHIWIGRIESGDFMSGGAGRTIVWNKEGGIFVTETYRQENLRSDVIRVRQNTAEKIVDPTAGELITTSYS